MSGPRLPSVRLPAIIAGQAGDDEGEDAVLVELPPSSRFGIAWPAESTPPLSAPAERPVAVSLSSSEGETDTSEEEPSGQARRFSRSEEGEESEFVTPTNHLHSDRDPMEQVGPSSSAPRISRAFSMPLPSQLGPFQNPRRVTPSSDASPMAGPSEEPVHLQELSLELADSVQMVIQTLLQLSPPQVLDPAKEQFSACSLSIPTPSVSAIFTSMKNLNYMSANMSTFSIDAPASCSSTPGRSRAASGTSTYVDFDVGEMLQSVGDALSGVAAQAGVDLVLFHDDLGMRHVAVKGDESGLSYTLSHILRQIISVAKERDSIEIGLFIESVRGSQRSSSPGAPSRSTSPSLDADGPLRCSFHIAHRFGMQEPPSSPAAAADLDEYVQELHPDPLPPSRNMPSFQTLILRRLLQHVGAQLEREVMPKGPFVGRCCVLSATLDRGAPSVVDPTVSLSPEDATFLGFPADLRIAHEPTLEQLTQFAESLRGRKVTLVAHSKGSFAKHLTSYLTAWGLDVSHVSTEPDAEGISEGSEKSTDGGDNSDSATSAFGPEQPTPAAPAAGSPNGSEPFILIDDDVAALRARLTKIRAEQAYPLNLHGRKRPSLASHHRPRSSPQVARVMGLAAQPAQVAAHAVIVHFTSLANFKLVKDAIQSIIAPGGSWTRLPEVIVIPKPAGPRRILTALHTAVTKPIVDPFFAPIATSPVSPSLHPMSPLFSTATVQRSPGGRSTNSMRTNSDRSTRSPKDGVESSGFGPSSPLGMTDHMGNLEYFGETASKLGSSPSSGLVISSPDGLPAGIIFNPTAKGKNSPHAERGPAPMGSEHSTGRARGTSFRRASDGRDSERGFSFTQRDLPPPRRSPRPPPPPEVSIEPAPEIGPTSTVKSPGRQSIHTESTSDEVELILTTTSETVGPKLNRRTSQDPRSSPPLSPQARLPGNAAGPRRPAKRPTAESSASAPAAIPKKGNRGGENNIVPPISVLIVDDNPINQTILSTFMKKKKIKYDVAKNGEEAVQKWRSGGFHLILMDIQMPVMDGIQATKEIRRLEKSNGVGGFPTTPQSDGQQTPSEASSDTRSVSTPSYRSSVIIVALTASSLQSDRVAALAAGCNDFLTKPVSLHWLNSKIIEWGSIKALQMWADIRPEVVRSITTGQAVQARNVANRLHVPEGRSTPILPRSRSTSQSRKAGVGVNVDAAVAAAATLSKGDKTIVPSPNSQGSPASSSESVSKVGVDGDSAAPAGGLDTSPDALPSDSVQDTPEPVGEASPARDITSSASSVDQSAVGDADAPAEVSASPAMATEATDSPTNSEDPSPPKRDDKDRPPPADSQ